jgi:hypothetical protein
MKARMPFDDRTIARTFAVATYAFSLFLAFFAGVLSGTHAAAGAPYVFVPGAGLAVLSPFIWFGARWAMILACLVGVAIEVAIGMDSGEWWLLLAVPASLAMLTLMHAIARASDRQPASQAAVIDKVHAGPVHAYGFVAALAAPVTHTYRLEAPITSSYAVVLGLALGAMSCLIWRGASWAKIVACALVTAQWLVLGSLDPAFWANSVYAAPPGRVRAADRRLHGRGKGAYGGEVQVGVAAMTASRGPAARGILKLFRDLEPAYPMPNPLISRRPRAIWAP